MKLCVKHLHAFLSLFLLSNICLLTISQLGLQDCSWDGMDEEQVKLAGPAAQVTAVHTGRQRGNLVNTESWSVVRWLRIHTFLLNQ